MNINSQGFICLMAKLSMQIKHKYKEEEGLERIRYRASFEHVCHNIMHKKLYCFRTEITILKMLLA